jgi:hypothetical protein
LPRAHALKLLKSLLVVTLGAVTEVRAREVLEA